MEALKHLTLVAASRFIPSCLPQLRSRSTTEVVTGDAHVSKQSLSASRLHAFPECDEGWSLPHSPKVRSIPLESGFGNEGCGSNLLGLRIWLQRPILLACILLGAAVQAEGSVSAQYLKSAVAHYEQLDYERALRQLEKAAAKAKTPGEQVQAALMLGIVRADSGKRSPALDAFDTAFAVDPTAKLPLVVSPKISALAESSRSHSHSDSADVVTIPANFAKLWPESVRVCADVDLALDGIWTPNAKTLVLKQLQKGPPSVSAASLGLVREIDSWVKNWGEQRLATCLRNEFMRDPKGVGTSSALLCLDRSTDAFTSLIEVLVSGTVVSEATLQIVDRLPNPTECARVRRAQGPAGAQNPEGTKAWRLLSSAFMVLGVEGDSNHAQSLINQARPMVSNSSDALLKAELDFVDGILRIQAEPAVAIASLYRSVTVSLELGENAIALRSLRRLIEHYGTAGDLATVERLYRWAKRLAQDGADSSLELAQLERSGAFATGQRNPERGLAFCKRALEQLEQSTVVNALRERVKADILVLAAHMAFNARSPDARSIAKRADEISARIYEAQHPHLVTLQLLQAFLALEDGALEEAERMSERALTPNALLNPWQEVQAKTILSIAYYLTQRYSLAEPAAEFVVTQSEATDGPECATCPTRWLLLGDVLRESGRVAQGADYHERALSVIGKQLEKTPEPVLYEDKLEAETALARDYVALKQWERARQYTNDCMNSSLRRSLPGHLVMDCEMTQAEVLWALGKAEPAVQAAKRATKERKAASGMEKRLQSRVRVRAQSWLKTNVSRR